MDVIGQLTSNTTYFLLYVVPGFLFVLTMIVFWHELGHFVVARWCGVRVRAFSLGFGREIVGFTDRKGTRWKLSILPLGGYVQFMDDENAASAPGKTDAMDEADLHDPGRFHTKPLWQRAAVVAAGPVANFLLAIAIFAGVYMVNGFQNTVPRVDQVVEESAASEAGFEVGDVVLSVDGRELERFRDLQRVVSGRPGETLSFRVLRRGREIGLTAVPREHELQDRFGNKYTTGWLGIQYKQTQAEGAVQSVGPVRALQLGVEDTYFYTVRTVQFIRKLFLGLEDVKKLGGPLRIAEVSGQFATYGMNALIQIVAILSISIGLLNLFPVPMLDGGHLLFYAIEAIRGQPLSERVQEFGFRIGLALVVMLMLFTTWNDVMRLASKLSS